MTQSNTLKAIRELSVRIAAARKTLDRERAALKAMIEQRRKLRDTLPAWRLRPD